MSEAFRLTLPESDIRLNMLQAAGLTASAMCKVNHSAEFVINLINETYLDVSRCCFKPRQLTITVNDQNMWGKANMFIGMFQAILDERKFFDGELSAQVHVLSENDWKFHVSAPVIGGQTTRISPFFAGIFKQLDKIPMYARTRKG